MSEALKGPRCLDCVTASASRYRTRCLVSRWRRIRTPSHHRCGKLNDTGRAVCAVKPGSLRQMGAFSALVLDVIEAKTVSHEAHLSNGEKRDADIAGGAPQLGHASMRRQRWIAQVVVVESRQFARQNGRSSELKHAGQIEKRAPFLPARPDELSNHRLFNAIGSPLSADRCSSNECACKRELGCIDKRVSVVIRALSPDAVSTIFAVSAVSRSFRRRSP